MNEGVCALCLSAADLQNSHIIPEFAYQAMYDAAHRFHTYQVDDEVRRRFEQKGLREPLLCRSCEGILATYERYVSLLFRGDLSANTVVSESGKLVVVSPVDCRVIRLFLLSVLWRASVSRLPFFSRVNLGPYEEDVRRMIIDGQAEPYWKYGCLIAAPLLGGEPRFDVMIQPTLTRVDSRHVYRFMFCGLTWCYFIGKTPHPRRIETASLDGSGELRFLKTRFTDLTYAADAFTKMANFSERR